MATSTLRRDDDVKDDRKAAAGAFLGDHMPLPGVRRYGIFGERDLAECRAKIGPVGWRRCSKHPGTKPETTRAAWRVR